MPEGLVADEIGLGMTLTMVAAAMLCKLLAENAAKGLPLIILWGNTLEEWVSLAHNVYLIIVCETWG